MSQARFILGRCGSGKTQWMLDRIAGALRSNPLGPPIYWILPRQATFQAERVLACTRGLRGFFRARVVSFNQLGHDILTGCGGCAGAEIDAIGRQMTFGYVLRLLAPRLHYFGASAHQPGLAAALDATFAEIQRCGLDPKDLPGAGNSQSDAPRSPALAAKLADLHLVFTEYQKRLGDQRLDPQGRLARALASLPEWKSLRGALMFVDGFYDFTMHERRLLSGLSRYAASVDIALTLDPDCAILTDLQAHCDELGSFHKAEQTFRSLALLFRDEGIAIAPPVCLRTGRRFTAGALAELESSFGRNPAPAHSAGAITFLEAADLRSEVNAAARRIKSLAAGGMRYRDIVVLARDFETYRTAIEASFAEHGITWFADRRRSASFHPLPQLVRAAFGLVRGNWPQDAVTALLKSGLAPLTAEEAETLESYALRHGIRHGLWHKPPRWTGRRAGDDETAPSADPQLDRVNLLRNKFVDPLREFAKKVFGKDQSIRQRVAALFELFTTIGVRQTIAGWMRAATDEQRFEAVEEHEQVWKSIVNLFEQLVETLGDEVVSLADFSGILEAGLEQLDLAVTPPTLDQVLVGDVDRTRTPPARAAIVLGVAEGLFPRISREDSVFSNADRRWLRKANVDIDPDTQRRLLDEKFWAYIAFTRASEQLHVSRPSIDQRGHALGPSIFWNELRAQFPDAPVETAKAEAELPPEMISTPRQLIGGLMQWARLPDEIAPREPAIWPALYQALALYQPLATHRGEDDLRKMRDRAWPALNYRNDAKLHGHRLFASPLNAPIAQFESYRNCPFQHFARFGLRLQPRASDDIGAIELSQAYHAILNRMLGNLLSKGKSWVDVGDEQIEAMIADVTRNMGATLRDDLMLGSARNQYLLKRIEKTLHEVVAAQRAAQQRGDFRAARGETSFGEEADAPALLVTTPGGAEVRVSGRIDRVDVDAIGAAASVIDYQNRAGRLPLHEVYHGLSLRLLTYMLALQSFGVELFGKKVMPVAAFSVQLLRMIADGDPLEALAPDDPAFDLQIKPRGLFDVSVLPRLDATLQSGASEVVNAYINKDGALGRRDTSDAIDPAELNALLAHVQRKIGEISDGILSGNIAVAPYMMGNRTPCPRCAYRDVCRFDPVVDRYVQLESMKRDEVIGAIASEKQSHIAEKKPHVSEIQSRVAEKAPHG